MAYSYRYIGIVYSFTYEYFNAIYYFRLSYNEFKKINHHYGLMQTNLSLGINYLNTGELELSEYFFHQALGTAQKTEDKINESKIYNKLGNIYVFKNDFDKALEYFYKDYEQTKKLENNIVQAFSLRNIGRVYKLKNNWNKGREHLTRSLTLFNKTDDKINQLITEIELYEAIRLNDDFDFISIKEKFENHYIIGKSPLMKKIIKDVNKVTSIDVTVLITGETGIGKELLARYIHYNSPRRDKIFMTVNCGAIPEQLIESELFGHKKGSFTGASSDKIGRIKMANGGTLFLDEIGELSPKTQVALLRFLQEKEIQVVGSELSETVDVRIIAATNKNLEELISKELFRKDLFYRLSPFPIYIPPLRERKDDIIPLTKYFINHYSQIYRKKIQRVENNVLKTFKEYNWPGNIRELKNVIERMILLADTHKITMDNIKFLNNEQRVPADRFKKLDEIEKEYIFSILKHTRGNKKEAARILGIHRNTLYQKLEKYNFLFNIPPVLN